MRYREIIAETGDSNTSADTWESRFADTQRKEKARTKAVRKLGDAQRRAADQARTAAAQRSRAADRIADAKRDLSEPA